MDNSASAIYSKLETSRKELLDLGLRNPLLNYRLLRARGIEITDELAEEVFRILMLNKKAMSFLPAPNEEDGDGLLAQPEEESEPGKPAARHVDHRLQTSHSSSQLQSRLLKTYGVARTFIEERGVNALFLAMGMLNWYESDSSQVTRRAPLVLVPVALERASASERFRVSYTEQDIGENLSLSEKLKAEFGMALPQLPDIEDLNIQTYFNDVEQAVRSEKRWSIDRNALAIGFFSFGKFLMYHDLDVTRWPHGTNPLAHPIIRALLHDNFSEASSEFSESDQIDKHIDPATVHHVMDADSSQILAILDVIRGRNLVIQGPPGTGKSQTITNLIAETVGMGKTVLFVAEKMAALEVVKRRLDNIGLGEACLELHSHKTQKRAVLDELRKTLNLGKPKLPQSANDLEMLRSMRDRLNSYCEAINTPIGLSEVIPYQAYGELIKLQKRLDGITVPDLGLDTIHTWDGPTFARRQALIEEMQNHIKITGSPKDNPFWGTRRTVLLPTEQSRLQDLLLEAQHAVSNLSEAATSLASTLGLPIPTDRAGAKALCRYAKRILEAPSLKGIRVNADWLASSDELDELLDAGATFASLHQQYDEALTPEVWEQDLAEIERILRQYGQKWWRFLSGKYRNVHRQLAALSRLPLPPTTDAQLRLVNDILLVQQKREFISQQGQLGAYLFGRQWQNEVSDWTTLEQIARWIRHLHDDVNIGKVPQVLIDFLASRPNLQKLNAELSTVEQALDAHSLLLPRAFNSLEIDPTVRFGADRKLKDQTFQIQDNTFSE